jgi:hypothetical protein
MAFKTLPDRTLLHQLLRYDAESGELIWLPRPRDMFTNQRQFLTWNLRYAGKQAGTFRAGTAHRDGYRKIGLNGSIFGAHRLVWLYVNGEPVPNIIDHKDHNPLNNRIENLRASTMAQNRANSFVRSDNALGIKGVSAARNRFMAKIGHRGKLLYLGTFDTTDEAIAAYKEAAAKLFGEFARWDQR